MLPYGNFLDIPGAKTVIVYYMHVHNIARTIFFVSKKISLIKELIWQEISASEGFLKAFSMIEYKLVGSQGFYFDLGVHLKTGDCQVNKVQVVMYLYIFHIKYLHI